jgi:hypothetical protein
VKLLRSFLNLLESFDGVSGRGPEIGSWILTERESYFKSEGKSSPLEIFARMVREQGEGPNLTIYATRHMA